MSHYLDDYVYKKTYDIPLTGNEEAGQLNQIVFDAVALQTTISFFNDEVIPALESETAEDLVSKFGGKEALELAINTGEEQITDMIGVHDEYYYEDPETLIGIFKALRDFYSMILAQPRNFETYLG